MAILDNIKAAWKLDESSGNAADSSGNGFTLTNNGTTAYSTGKINNGAVFNNTVGKNLDYAGNLGFAGGGTRTWMAWVNVSSFAATGYILDNTTTTTSDRRFILYSENDSKIHMYANGNEVLTPALSTSTWYHCVVTQNGSTWELFYNGVSQGTTAEGAASNSDNSFRIGESYAGGGAGKSTNDMVTIWDRVLTGTEITNLYNSGVGIQYPFSSSSTANYLVVAGAGGGGSPAGGGAGGYQAGTLSLTAGAYSVTVGTGGSGGVYATTPAGYGTDSSFNGLKGNGGGRGGDVVDIANIGGDGGCGGGGSPTAGTGNQGGNGGTGFSTTVAGGGGGASAAGTGGSAGQGGVGGNGSTWSINSTVYAGGGGGNTNGATGGGAGGTGGGGAGINNAVGGAGTNGLGGGGGAGGGGSNGGRGGDGVVIVAYKTDGSDGISTSSTGGSTSTSGSYTLHTFTTSGTWTMVASSTVVYAPDNRMYFI